MYIYGIYKNGTEEFIYRAAVKKDICIPLFVATLFTIARTWKPPRCPLTDECIKKLWYIYTMVYYSAITSKAPLSQF